MYEVTTPVQTEHRIGRKNESNPTENYRFRMKKPEINFFSKPPLKIPFSKPKNKTDADGRPVGRPAAWKCLKRYFKFFLQNAQETVDLSQKIPKKKVHFLGPENKSC